MPLPKRSWASAACGVWVAGALAVTGCGETASEPAPGAELTVYVSLPLRGPLAADGRDAADGARLALAEADREAAGFAVRAELIDDTEGSSRDALASPAEASANARAASEDSTAIAYIGELTSGATRASLPVTNEARMLQVSPGAGAVDLVSEFRGTDEVPSAQPRGERSFGRVIPADDLQAGAAAAWARKLDTRRVLALHDGSAYGRALTESFEQAALEIGFEVERGELPHARQPLSGRGELVFYAGSPEPGAGELVAAAEMAGARTVIGTDAILDPRFSADLPAASPSRPLEVPELLATSGALDPAQLPGDFVTRFRAEYGRAPGRFAAYGYEAMALVLDSIERASDPADREAVSAAFFATEERDSILGTYSITELGEPTLDRFTGYRLTGGHWRPEAELFAP